MMVGGYEPLKDDRENNIFSSLSRVQEDWFSTIPAPPPPQPSPFHGAHCNFPGRTKFQFGR